MQIPISGLTIRAETQLLLKIIGVPFVNAGHVECPAGTRTESIEEGIAVLLPNGLELRIDEHQRIVTAALGYGKHFTTRVEQCLLCKRNLSDNYMFCEKCLPRVREQGLWATWSHYLVR